MYRITIDSAVFVLLMRALQLETLLELGFQNIAQFDTANTVVVLTGDPTKVCCDLIKTSVQYA